MITLRLRRVLHAAAVLSYIKGVTSLRADTTAIWNGGSGNWSDPTQWSSNPNYPHNGTPASTLYDAVLNSGLIFSTPVSKCKT